jgi:hypothetical protein
MSATGCRGFLLGVLGLTCKEPRASSRIQRRCLETKIARRSHQYDWRQRYTWCERNPHRASIRETPASCSNSNSEEAASLSFLV